MVQLKKLKSSSLLFLSSALYANAAVITPDPATPGGPIVNLGYSTYQGHTLPNGVNEWLGLRFAAPPVGDLRFRKPTAPQNTTGIIQADNYGPVCFGLRDGISAKFGEDCLFLNLWGPSNITQDSKVPVFFWLTGGGFNRNANANYNGSELVEAAGHDMIFVSINYRVGPFGFLASQEVSANGQMDLNVGLHDELFALRWVQQYIRNFGGSPDRVVLVGDSAGAGSIAVHLVTRYQQPETLFHGIFGLSPFFPAQFHPADLQWQFDRFAEKVGCGGSTTSSDKLACLRGKDGITLQNANEVKFPYPGRTNNAVVPYTPCVDNDLLTDYPLNLFVKGEYRKLPSIFGHDTNEGSLFAVNANNTNDIATFFMDNFPQLNSTDTANIISHYPEEASLPQHGPWFPSASAAFGDTVLSCPALALSSYLAPFADSWAYRYDANTPSQEAAGTDVFHQCELPPLFGRSNTFGQPVVGPESFRMTPVLQKYYTNFVRFLDPNEPTVPQQWPQWKPDALMDATGTRFRFSLDPNQNFSPATNTEQVSSAQLAKCKFWRSLQEKMGQ